MSPIATLRRLAGVKNPVGRALAPSDGRWRGLRPSPGARARAAIPLVAAATIFLTGQSGAAQADTAVLAVDQSQHMARTIGGVPKATIFANAVARALEQAPADTVLGLAAYGHERGAGCASAQVILPPKVVSAPEHGRALAELRGGGEAAIGEVLENAAAALPADGQPVRIIIVSGGPHKCERDPCATARTLKAGRSELTIDAIAINDGSAESAAGIECTARLTGGRFIATTDEAELTTALTLLIANAKSASTAGVIGIPGSTAAAGGAADGANSGAAGEATSGWETTVRASVQQGGDGGAQSTAVPVQLLALLYDNGPVIDAGLVWRIFQPAEGDTSSYQLVETIRDAAPIVQLPPGDYLVNAAYGRAYITKPLSVSAGTPLRDAIVLNAGGLRLGATMNNVPAPREGVVHFNIYSDERDQFDNRSLVMENAPLARVIRLNAGIYHVVSVYGDANAIVAADVSVEAGKLTDATLNHLGARVSFKLVTQPGGEALAETQWRILTSNGELVRKSFGALPSHLLAAGRYQVRAERRDREYVRDFTVEAGVDAEIEVLVE